MPARLTRVSPQIVLGTYNLPINENAGLPADSYYIKEDWWRCDRRDGAREWRSCGWVGGGYVRNRSCWLIVPVYCRLSRKGCQTITCQSTFKESYYNRGPLLPARQATTIMWKRINLPTTHTKYMQIFIFFVHTSRNTLAFNSFLPFLLPNRSKYAFNSRFSPLLISPPTLINILP